MMIEDDKAKLLHHKLTLGEMLTAEEKALLLDWYIAHDEAEADVLDQLDDQIDLVTLQTQVDEASAQLSAVTERIRQVTDETKVIRQENIRLRQQLVDKKQPV
jgi:hypothetical protein